MAARLPALLLLSLWLPGCAVFSGSHQQRPAGNIEAVSLTATQAGQIATDTVDFLKRRYPPAQTIFFYQPAGDTLDAAFVNALRAAGYGLAAAAGEGYQPLTFVADAVGSLRYISFSVGVVQVNRLYRINPDGSLKAVGATEKQRSTMIKPVSQVITPAKKQRALPVPARRSAKTPPAKLAIKPKVQPPIKWAKKPVTVARAADLKIIELEHRAKMLELKLAALEKDKAALATVPDPGMLTPETATPSRLARIAYYPSPLPANRPRPQVQQASLTKKPVLVNGMLPPPSRQALQQPLAVKTSKQAISPKPAGLGVIQLMAGTDQADLQRHAWQLRKAGHQVQLVKLKQLTALRVLAPRRSIHAAVKKLRAFYHDAYIVSG